MLCGRYPFEDPDAYRRNCMITRMKVKFPTKETDGFDISTECQDFISRCLEKDPTKRLGANGAKEIFEHSWFQDYDETKLKDMVKKKLEAPIKPTVGDDLCNIVNMNINDPKLTKVPSNKMKIITENEEKFEGLTME